jgi:hypothetical protein
VSTSGPKALDSLRAAVRPLTIGLSIGSRYGSAGGTLGVFVSDESHRPGFLTSATALGAGRARKNELVFQPSSLDAGTLSASDAVGRLSNFGVLTNEGPNDVDAALVTLDDKVQTTWNEIPDLRGCPWKLVARRVSPRSLPIEQLSLSTSVGKLGRTSGYTEGFVTAVGVSNLKVMTSDGYSIFSESIEITGLGYQPFSAAGDSGALVFTVPDLIPLGLVFASATSKSDPKGVSYACRLDRILEIFRVELFE